MITKAQAEEERQQAIADLERSIDLAVPVAARTLTWLKKPVITEEEEAELWVWLEEVTGTWADVIAPLVHRLVYDKIFRKRDREASMSTAVTIKFCAEVTRVGVANTQEAIEQAKEEIAETVIGELGFDDNFVVEPEGKK